jgi:hypothetical protein
MLHILQEVGAHHKHNIIKELHDGPFPKRSLRLINFDNLRMFVEKFIVHNLIAPQKWRISKLKKNSAHVIHGSSEPEHNQEVV